MYRLILISTLMLYLLILSVQAGNHSATSIVLSTGEVNAIGKAYDAKVASVAPPVSAPPAPTTTEDAAPQLHPNLKGWKISARTLYNATVNALTSHTKKIGEKPRIVLFVGVTLNGGYGVEAVDYFADNGYQVTLPVLPRYKSELLKEEAADNLWDAHLQTKNKKNITVQDFRTNAASIAATQAIADYRKQLMEDHSEILANTKLTPEDRIARIQGRPESSKAKALKQELDGLLLAERDALEVFLGELNLENCVAIDSIVAAGFESADEIQHRYVIRYDSAQAVSRHLNERQADYRVVTGSYDSLSNTTTEFGYYHVTKDHEMKVSRIPDSHIPNFMVIITYPRESVMALEGADPPKAGTVRGPSAGTVCGPSAAVPNVAYQYQNTKIYVTVYVDPDHPDVSMAECIESETKYRTRNNNDDAQDDDDAAKLDAFVKELKCAEDEYKSSGYVNDGFMQVNLPTPVAASVAYIAGIAEIPKYKDIDIDITEYSVCPVAVTKVAKYLSFADYAAKFAQMGNRRTRQ